MHCEILPERPEAQGYELVLIRDARPVGADADYQVAEFLAWRRVLYVDDQIADRARRSRRCGLALMH